MGSAVSVTAARVRCECCNQYFVPAPSSAADALANSEAPRICTRCDAALVSHTLQGLDQAQRETSSLLYILHVGAGGGPVHASPLGREGGGAGGGGDDGGEAGAGGMGAAGGHQLSLLEHLAMGPMGVDAEMDHILATGTLSTFIGDAAGAARGGGGLGGMGGMGGMLEGGLGGEYATYPGGETERRVMSGVDMICVDASHAAKQPTCAICSEDNYGERTWCLC